MSLEYEPSTGCAAAGHHARDARTRDRCAGGGWRRRRRCEAAGVGEHQSHNTSNLNTKLCEIAGVVRLVLLRRCEAAGVGERAGGVRVYRGISLERKRTPLEPYRRPMPRVLGGS